MKVATSIVLGNKALPELAAKAVLLAMEKADITIASSVLLFLTSEFASDPQPAIKAAAKVANCTQIIGCSATGIFTEDDWVLDAPAAAVMVFGDDVSLQIPSLNHGQQPLLTITAPNAVNSTWLNKDVPNKTNIRFGGVSGDATGQGPFSVWQNAKGEVSGYVEVFFDGAKAATRASHGLQMLTQPQQIQQVNHYDLERLDNNAPLNSLKKAWRMHAKNDEAIPLHLIMAVYANSAEEIHAGEFYQTSIISYDESNSSITLAQPLEVGQFLSWGLRDQVAAEADLMLVSHELCLELGSTPDFGLLFSCLGRGPYFYDGVDRDLKLLIKQFPNMPILGFYGNGEIASIGGINQLLPYSAVLSLFASQTKI